MNTRLVLLGFVRSSLIFDSSGHLILHQLVGSALIAEVAHLKLSGDRGAAVPVRCRTGVRDPLI